MADVVDLDGERNRRTQPAAEHIRHDDFGRPMYRFLLRYEMAGAEWGTGVWAYDFDDAAQRVAAMRASLSLDGQAFSTL